MKSERVLLTQSEGAGVLLLTAPTFEHDGEKYGLEIHQFKQRGKYITYQASISKEVTAEHYQSGQTTTYQTTVQDDKLSFDSFDELLKAIKAKFHKEFYFLPDVKILRCSVTINEALGRSSRLGSSILEDDVLLFIAKNPQVTQEDLTKLYGFEVADYTSRWKHDYGKETSPLIEESGNGWQITPQGLAFLEDKEASY